jgi:hypothetical protein
MGLHFAPRSAAAPSSSAVPRQRTPLAQQHQRHVRERREVAAGAHRAAAGQHRHDARVEDGQRVLDQLAAHAAVAAREVGDAQREGQAAHVASRCGPTPAAWLRTRLSCRRRSCASGTRTLASLPKPVLMP